MTASTFFGHRERYGLDSQVLLQKIEDLIHKGVDTFYVGNQGHFDSMVYNSLMQFRKEHLHIKVCVVLAYLPTAESEDNDMVDTMCPEIEDHPKYAIERRNRWMINHSDYCICYINHTWGGAYKFARWAKRRGTTIINIGSTNIDL